MGDVINLPKPEAPEYCLVCGCESQDFCLIFGGTLQCKHCGKIMTTAVWIHLPPEILKEVKR